MHHLTYGISSLLNSVNLLLFTLLSSQKNSCQLFLSQGVNPECLGVCVAWNLNHVGYTDDRAYDLLRSSSSPVPDVMLPTALIKDINRWKPPILTVTFPRFVGNTATISEALWNNGWSNQCHDAPGFVILSAFIRSKHQSWIDGTWFGWVKVDKWECMNRTDCIQSWSFRDFLHETSPWWPWQYFHGATCHPQKVQLHASHQGSRCFFRRQRRSSDSDLPQSRCFGVFVCFDGHISKRTSDTCRYIFLAPWHWCAPFNVYGRGDAFNTPMGWKVLWPSSVLVLHQHYQMQMNPSITVLPGFDEFRRKEFSYRSASVWLSANPVLFSRLMRSLWPYLRCMYTATLKKIGDTKDLVRLAVMIACWIVRCRLSVCEFCFFHCVVEWHHQQSILAFLETSPWLFPSKKSLLDRCHYQRCTTWYPPGRLVLLSLLSVSVQS